MNTLDDLRATLEGHGEAAAVEALDTSTRGRQLHQRIRAVRRRRTAGGAAAAALAVVAAASFALLPGDPAPDPATEVPDELAGHRVPEEMVASGWTYDYLTSAQGDGSVELTLPASDEPRLVSWAGTDARPVWPLEIYDGLQKAEILRSGRADFGDWWLLRAGPELRVVLDGGRGPAALAAYTLSDERPPGLTSDGLTYREEIAADRLVAAGTVRGASTLTVDLEIPSGTLRFGAVCNDLPRVAQVELSVDGEAVATTGCDAGWFHDPGLIQSLAWPDGLDGFRPGQRVRAEVRLVDDDGDPVSAAPDSVLGAGFYEQAPPATRVAGSPVPELLDVAGHLWRLDRTREGRDLSVRIPDPGPLLVYAYYEDVLGGRVALGVQGDSGGEETSVHPRPSRGTDSRGALGPVLSGPGGTTVDVDLTGAVGPDARVGLAWYVRAD